MEKDAIGIDESLGAVEAEEGTTSLGTHFDFETTGPVSMEAEDGDQVNCGNTLSSTNVLSTRTKFECRRLPAFLLYPDS